MYEEILILTFIFIFIGLVLLGLFLGFKKIRKSVSEPVLIIEYILIISYLLYLFLFQLALSWSSEPYYVAIDPASKIYNPFAENHITTLIIFYLFFPGSSILLWLKGRKIPPLTLVLSAIFIIIGTIISFLVLVQLSESPSVTDPSALFF